MLAKTQYGLHKKRKAQLLRYRHQPDYSVVGGDRVQKERRLLFSRSLHVSGGPWVFPSVVVSGGGFGRKFC